MEPPGLLHRHCRVGLGGSTPSSLLLFMALLGKLWIWGSSSEGWGWLVSVPLVLSIPGQ